jgi:hypothetical protein
LLATMGVPGTFSGHRYSMDGLRYMQPPVLAGASPEVMLLAAPATGLHPITSTITSRVGGV